MIISNRKELCNLLDENKVKYVFYGPQACAIGFLLHLIWFMIQYRKPQRAEKATPQAVCRGKGRGSMRMTHPKKNEQWVFSSEIEATSADTGVSRKVLAFCDAAMCVENTFETGAVGKLHSHPHTQITYVAQGAFSFVIDGVARTVRKGDVLLKTDGVEHGCTCLEAGVLVDFFTPMRADFVNGEYA